MPHVRRPCAYGVGALKLSWNQWNGGSLKLNSFAKFIIGDDWDGKPPDNRVVSVQFPDEFFPLFTMPVICSFDVLPMVYTTTYPLFFIVYVILAN